ncbi:hypothetical protein VMUT_1099 [Vulcanisaeta moutnovskia 768-28]|uniref:Uncharacterized protein n=1 Tax=Vulcanisaeta moutnovskia (strain 768-28) TaxID=985053 RepID=F0QY67_VULM7|nr:hypothetical protein [Vulcanisaeta moutnovskia]ADY01304.1 hypothetical protein VMUT_1099 [Vulcanisaeta moutnovskia 768-28]
MFIPPEEALGLIRDFLNNTINVVSLQLIQSTKKLALRLGVWWRIDPLRRGLLEASIPYLRQGLRFKSPKVLGMLREAVIEALSLVLMRKAKFIAYLVGRKLVERLDWVRAVVRRVQDIINMGLMWLNTPIIYRPELGMNTTNP